MARERYLIGISQEELAPPPPKPRLTLWQRLQIFWDNNKIAVIIGAVMLFGAAMIAAQMLNREKYDYTLVVATKSMLHSYVLEDIQDTLADYGEDLDGDGEVKIRIIHTFSDSVAESQRLDGILFSGDEVFFAFDRETYRRRVTKDFFRELDAGGPGLSADKTYWDWAGDPLCLMSPTEVPENLYFGIRAGNGSEETMQCKKLLENYINK
ncbi:MAG: hypothetical protein FWE80_04865 [Oscillospiraceae bacterium]|nr:hypothetical protein [Oscillospiraceae bacterium]